jgi:hypothetical protein
MIKRNYGWHQRPLPYHAGLQFSPTRASLDDVPQEVDWRLKVPSWPDVYDQGSTGSCVGQGLKRAAHVSQIIQGLNPVVEPSSMFIYYNARETEGACGEDSGANVCDGLLGLITEGFCAEGDWTLNPGFITQTPGDKQYQFAQLHRVTDYQPTTVDVSDVQALCEALTIRPLVGGILVFDSFESAAVVKSGDVPMPNEDSENVIGGHCMFFRGYSIPRKVVFYDNSWGKSFGNEGSGTLPFEYLRRFGSDFWQISQVS